MSTAHKLHPPRNRPARAWLGALLLALSCSLAVPAAANVESTDPELRQLLRQAIAEASGFQDRFDAEVWLVDMSQRLQPKVNDSGARINLLKRIHHEATRSGLPPELVLAVIEVESNFDRWAISEAGAQGLMQIMPFWLKEIGRPDDNLFDVATNLRLGCTILRYYYDKERGNWSRALARYNGSLGSFKYPDRVFRALKQRWSSR